MPAPPNLRLWLIALLACVIAVVYWPTSVYYDEKWSDTLNRTYTHGWLILIICAALVFRSRHELAAAPARASPLAQALLAAAVIAWLVSYRASIEGMEVLLVPLIFWLAVAAAFGWRVGRVLLFPVAYFYFAVPVWVTPLRSLTVLAMHGALALTGPPTQIDGDVFHIPNGTFVIEEGCSGLHYMIVGLAVAALYGEQRRDPWRARARQLALMAGLAVLANWVRVYTIIQAGYLTNMQSYLVRHHYWFGWCVFALALFVFFWLAPRFGPAAAPEPLHATAPPPRTAGLLPELTRFAGAVGILVALPALSAAARMAHPPPAGAAEALDPRGTWHSVPLDEASSWLPVFSGADALQREAFGNAAGDSIEVLTVAFRTQRQGAELVGETSSLLGDGLEALAVQEVGSAAGAFRETEVADAAGARSLLWSRYQVAGRNLLGPVAQQLWYGVNAIVWRPPAGLVALHAACRPDCDGARRTLRDFVANSDLR